MKVKRHYDDKHTSIYMRKNDYVFIKLHHNYDISFIAIFKSKYSQQYVKSFRILKRIDKLIYRLDLFNHWRIHSILFIAQLKSCFDSTTNSFSRSRSNHSNFVFVKKNIERVKSYEIEKLINKWQTKRRESKYLMRWRNYELKHDDWKNLSKLEDAQRLVQKYENVHRKTITLFDRLKITFIEFSQQKSIFVEINQRKSTQLRKSFVKTKTITANDSMFRKTITTSFSFFITSSFSVASSFFIMLLNRSFVVVILKKTITAFAFNTSFTFVVVDDTSSFASFTTLISRRFVRLLKKS